MKEKKMTYKDRLALITSSISFALGWLLVVINFMVSPIGEVSDSSLWILGQSLVYTGSVIGIAQYTKGELRKIRYKVGIKEDDDDNE